MPIIKHTKGYTNDIYLMLFPDQYASESEKAKEGWIKTNMDYFANVAYQQYQSNSATFTKNYNLVKGIINREDFYEEPEVKSFTDTVMRGADLPAHVKHYSILNSPLNMLLGEVTRRPDNARVRAFDEDSKNEEIAAKSQMLKQFIEQIIINKVRNEAFSMGMDPDSEENQEQVQEMTIEQLRDNMMSYTSAAESWGNHVLEAMKVGFNIKELSEDAFRDLLICAREFFHIYEDNSAMGFAVETLNPKNVWYLTTPDKKYTRDAYAAGFIQLMELSEVLDKYKLTKEEIDHLRNALKGHQEGFGRLSNLLNPKAVGSKSVTYDTYDPLVEQERVLLESQLQANNLKLEEFLGVGNNSVLNSFGTKLVVVQAYWKSKLKVGRLTYWDEETQSQQTVLVSEDYKKIPTEIKIEWEYINQWWKGTKIGQDVYIDVEPFELFNYCPIIGVVHDIKNSEARSLVDLMKPFQVLYNICMNQLYKLLDKDQGVVFLTSLRHLPKLADGDESDAIETWEAMAKEKGVIFIDDSPENLKAPSQFNQHSRVDLSRHNEMQGRYTMAQQLKIECWELVGITRERLGGSQGATQTATSTNSALAQSYAQTEPYFVQHEYVINQLYQGLIDAAQYIESNKPMSTLSYVNNMGESAFLQMNGSELKLRDLQVFVTSRVEDQRIFNELRQLAQPMLQNGASIYDIAVLYSTNSVRQMKEVFRALKERQEQMQMSQQQLEQQQLEQQQQQFQENMAYQDALRKEEMVNENYQKELDRLNKKEIAIINSFSRQDDNLKDTDGSGAPDILEISRLSMDNLSAEREHSMKLQELAMEKQRLNNEKSEQLEKIKLEKEKIKVTRENMKNDKDIAKIQASAKAKAAKSKPKPKKK